MDTIKPNFNAIVFAINIDEPPHKWCIVNGHLKVHHYGHLKVHHFKSGF